MAPSDNDTRALDRWVVNLFYLPDVLSARLYRDELHVESEVLEVRASKSRPDQGVIKVRTTTLNQDKQPVPVSVGNLIVPRRPPRAS